MLHRPSQRSTGFTIVELILAVVIIGILATISMFAYNQILKQSRDGKRDGDITTLQNELEKYYERNQEYPPGCPSASCTTWFLTENTSSAQMLNAAATLANITSVLPGVNADFGDPSVKGNNTPLMDVAADTKEYVYYGGTVNNRTTASSASYGGTTSFPCTIQSALNAGEIGSYVIGYFSESSGQWVLHSGKNGKLMTITTGSASDGCVINRG